MAKYTGPSCRLCRREGEKLFLKGNRCYNIAADGSHKDLCPFDKKDHKVIPPGPAHNGRKKNSDYSLQLREKQKCKRIYGLLEKQFYGYYEMAESMKGITGENMLILIERRLETLFSKWESAQAALNQDKSFVTDTFVLTARKSTFLHTL